MSQLITDYYKVELIKKSWSKKDGSTGESWCFTNRTPKPSGSLAGHEYSISFFRKDSDTNNTSAQSSEPAIHAWFNKMTDEMASAYMEEHGDIAWANEASNQIVTNAHYIDLFPEAKQEQLEQQVGF